MTCCFTAEGSGIIINAGKYTKRVHTGELRWSKVSCLCLWCIEKLFSSVETVSNTSMQHYLLSVQLYMVVRSSRVVEATTELIGNKYDEPIPQLPPSRIGMKEESQRNHSLSARASLSLSSR